MCVFLCIQVCKYAFRSQRSILGVICQVLSTLFSEKSFLTGLRWTDRIVWLAREPQGGIGVYFPSARLTSIFHQAWILKILDWITSPALTCLLWRFYCRLLPVSFRLAADLRCSCLSPLSSGVTGMGCHTQLVVYGDPWVNADDQILRHVNWCFTCELVCSGAIKSIGAKKRRHH